jgi:hypothetical protein
MLTTAGLSIRTTPATTDPATLRTVTDSVEDTQSDIVSTAADIAAGNRVAPNTAEYQQSEQGLIALFAYFYFIDTDLMPKIAFLRERYGQPNQTRGAKSWL